MIRLAYFNSKFYNWKSKFVCRREPKFWNPNFELKILCSCLTTPPFFPKLGPALLVSCKQKENAGEHAFISCISQTKNQKQHHGRLSFLQLTKREEHANVTSSKKDLSLCFFYPLDKLHLGAQLLLYRILKPGRYPNKEKKNGEALWTSWFLTVGEWGKKHAFNINNKLNSKPWKISGRAYNLCPHKNRIFRAKGETGLEQNNQQMPSLNVTKKKQLAYTCRSCLRKWSTNRRVVPALFFASDNPKKGFLFCRWELFQNFYSFCKLLLGKKETEREEEKQREEKENRGWGKENREWQKRKGRAEAQKKTEDWKKAESGKIEKKNNEK